MLWTAPPPAREYHGCGRCYTESDPGKGRFCCDHEARFHAGFSTQCLIVRGVAQSPQPRAMRRHALDWITHCPERLERPPINPKRQFLVARLPPPRMRPVINLRRTQHFSAARYESAPDPHLHRTAALGWRRRPVTQVTMVRPFHRGYQESARLAHRYRRLRRPKKSPAGKRGAVELSDEPCRGSRRGQSGAVSTGRPNCQTDNSARSSRYGCRGIRGQSRIARPLPGPRKRGSRRHTLCSRDGPRGQ